jgi:hypothetical protein
MVFPMRLGENVRTMPLLEFASNILAEMGVPTALGFPSLGNACRHFGYLADTANDLGLWSASNHGAKEDGKNFRLAKLAIPTWPRP